MGTRSLTVIKDENDEEIVVMYRQMDGYLSGHGKELKEFLDGFYIVNGYTQEDSKSEKAANGMSCLAGQLIAHFKKGIGGFYLEKAGTRDVGEAYVYTVYCDANSESWNLVKAKPKHFLNIKVESENVIYDGPVSKFDPDQEHE
jgi:hypothetical protein